MRYELEVRAYDVLDQVWAGLRVWETHNSLPGRSEVVLKVGISTAGVGESDPARWCRDVLVALAETL